MDFNSTGKPVFVLVTAKSCGFCTRFRRNWDSVRSTLEGSGLVRVVDIEVDDIGDPPDTKIYPRDLSRFARWYPTFLLIRGRTWDAALPVIGQSTPTVSLEGVVFNGELDNKGSYKWVETGPPPTLENLLGWCRIFAPKLYDSPTMNQSESVMKMLSSAAAGAMNEPMKTGIPMNNGPVYIPTATAASNKASVCRIKLKPRN